MNGHGVADGAPGGAAAGPLGAQTFAGFHTRTRKLYTLRMSYFEQFMDVRQRFYAYEDALYRARR